MNKCLIIAGEKSGEDHCLSFYRSIKKDLPEFQFFGVGGDELKNEGFELLYHLNDFSSIGFTEVIPKLKFYYDAMNSILTEVDKRDCKVAILIDFQSFNLKLAKKLSERGVKVLYYVAPQAWVWKEWRVKNLKKYTHTLFTILPFEKKWFKDRGLENIKAVEHPLIINYRDKLQLIKDRSQFDSKKEIDLLLLPGSRNFEVAYLLPEFLAAIKILKSKYKIKITLGRVSSVLESNYQQYLQFVDEVVDSEEIESVLSRADLCFAASGTVTLATALFELPTIVCYKANLVNEFLVRELVRYKGDISLGNIVTGEKIYPELIMAQASASNVARIATEWLENLEMYQQKVNLLKEVKHLLKGDDFNLNNYLVKEIKGAYEVL